MMQLKFSPISYCWFLIWHDQVLETFGTRSIAVNELRDRGLTVDKSGMVTVTDKESEQ